MGLRKYLRSFAGGEVSDQMWGRVDDIRFQTGVAVARNMMTLPHGAAVNRRGSRYVATTKDSGAKKSRVIEFQFSETEQLIIEMGEDYFRFYDPVTGQISYSSGPLYAANRPFSSAAAAPPASGVNIATDSIFFGTGVDHDLTTGDRIAITPDTPATVLWTSSPQVQYWLPENPVYFYAIVVDSETIQLATTKANALAGTQIIFLALGSGSNYRMHRAYEPGELTLFSNDYYCRQVPIKFSGSAYLSVTPGSDPDFWHQLTPGIFEVPHDYSESDLFDVNMRQSNDVITFTHKSYPPKELQRKGVTFWPFVTPEFKPAIGRPTNLQAATIFFGDQYTIALFVGSTNGTSRWRVGSTANNQATMKIPEGVAVYIDTIVHSPSLGDTPLTEGAYVIDRVTGSDFDLRSVSGHVATAFAYSPQANFTSARMREIPLSSDLDNFYKVTAVDTEGRESQPSDALQVANNLFAVGAYNTITWDGVAGDIDHYLVYKRLNGLYGWVAKVDAGEALQLKDENLEPDLGRPPPNLDLSLSGTDYPQAVGYFEQRRCFGGTALFPQQIWMTRSGTESDLSYSLPVKASDRVTFSISSREADFIRHMVALGDLIVLTNSSEYAVRSPEDSVITPDSHEAEFQSGRGASAVAPLVVDNVLVFEQNSGGHILSLGYQVASRGFVPDDLSLRSHHLFDGRTIRDSAISRSPYQVLWFVSSNGDLLGLTFVPGQEVLGWHRHDTGGASDEFESVAVVTIGGEDIVYAVVKRVVNSVTVRYIERFAPMLESTLANMVIVDSALTFTNQPAGTLSGLTHLATETVAILADGIVLPQQVVTAAGEITLPTRPAGGNWQTIQVGLPITSVLQTLPIADQVEGLGQGRKKNVSEIRARVADSCSFVAGKTLDNLKAPNAKAAAIKGELVAEVPADSTEGLPMPGGWDDDAQVFIQQSSPLPLTVVGLTLEVSYGG